MSDIYLVTARTEVAREYSEGGDFIRFTGCLDTPKDNSRPPVTMVYIKIAGLMAKRSPCPPGRRHGAVIVKDRRVLSTGYNGPPCGWKLADKCSYNKHNPIAATNCSCVHAEVNALLSAARNGVAIDGAILYCTKRPCRQCEMACINAGIIRVVYEEE